MKRFFFIPLIVLLATAGLVFAQKTIHTVTVVAPSPAAYETARNIITRANWTEAPFDSSDAVLVVVTSDLKDPLSTQYRKLQSLKNDAEILPKVTSTRWHVYVYDIEPDSSLTERSHNLDVNSF